MRKDYSSSTDLQAAIQDKPNAKPLKESLKTEGLIPASSTSCHRSILITYT